MSNLQPPSYPITPPFTPAESQKQSTAAELVRLAGIIDVMINDNDFTFTRADALELLGHIAPDFRAVIDCVRYPDQTQTWQELVEAWQKGSEEDPGVRFAWTSVSSTIDEVGGQAQLFIEKQITAVGGMKFHVMEEQQWQRDSNSGKWLLWRILGMRGTPANSGFDNEDLQTSLPGVVEQLRARPFEDASKDS
jgi:hypothetical protein